MKKLTILAVVLSIIFLSTPARVFADAPASGCTLCIVELQTGGASDATEEYVVVANMTASQVMASLKYYSAAGNLGITTNITIPPSSITSYISPVLKPANSNINGVWPSGMSSTSGTVQLVTTAGGVMDQVGWGTAVKKETTVIAAHAAGYSLVRKQTAPGVFQDTGNNFNDFVSTSHSCYNLTLNEIQPFSLDADGNDISPALEILKGSSANVAIDCIIAMNDANYIITSGDLSSSANLVVITNLLDSNSSTLPVPLNQSAVNNIQLLPKSAYADITATSSPLSQLVLSPGQTYAKIGSNWQATYAPTLGSSNVYAASPPVATLPNPQTTDDCSNVFISELLPNPSGDDTGHEWLELYNARTEPAYLSSCAVSINGTNYSFGNDQTIDSGSYILVSQFEGGSSLQNVTLKNSGTNALSFGHKESSGSLTWLQTIQYKDAPEAQSWARFDDGWRWVSSVTPGEENVIMASSPNDQQPTEFPAPADPSNETSDNISENPTPVIAITELLPNPAAPATDGNDEFIELYNPGSETVNLKGYRLQTGISYSYTYTFNDQTIPAGGYLVLTSSDTNLSLANSTGRARLLDPNGEVMSETDVYTDAPNGETWATIDNIWQWTVRPTPAGTNVAVAALPPILKTAISKKTVTAKTTAKTTKAPAVAKIKTAAAKKAPTKSSSTSGGAAGSKKTTSALHPAILAAGGVLALVYAGYEYRTDIANKIYKRRRDRKYRGALRAEP